MKTLISILILAAALIESGCGDVPHLGHDQRWNYASYEMENALGIRLGFPMGNR